mgnify:CR=1 FL=1
MEIIRMILIIDQNGFYSKAIIEFRDEYGSGVKRLYSSNEIQGAINDFAIQENMNSLNFLHSDKVVTIYDSTEKLKDNYQRQRRSERWNIKNEKPYTMRSTKPLVINTKTIKTIIITAGVITIIGVTAFVGANYKINRDNIYNNKHVISQTEYQMPNGLYELLKNYDSFEENMYAIIDTETTNGINNPLVYDVSVIIFDKTGNEYFRKNWLINEVWNNNELMDSAYYSWKKPLYEFFETFNTNMFDFVCEFNDVINEYNVTHILAYNLPFDIRALNNTSMKYIQGNMINENLIKLDIMVMACEIIANTDKYYNFCIENGFVSEKGNIQVYASIYDSKEANPELKPIESEKEWKVIETILETLQEEVRNQTGE